MTDGGKGAAVSERRGGDGPPVVRNVRRYFSRATSGVAIFPLVVLFLLYFFDEFDTAAFGVLAPNIQKAFHLSDRGFGFVVILNLTIILLVAVPLGYYADRLPRRTFVWIGAMLAGTFSFLTGTAGFLAALILYRIGNGFGLLINGGVHQSLLSDYYRPEDRPAVFSVHRNAVNLGAIVGPAIAGIVATVFHTWRAAFMVLIVPIVACGLIATRLKEPLRGGTEDPDAALAAALERPAPFDRAVRVVMAVRTLRRQYLSWVFIGAAFLPLAFYSPLFLERVFGVGDFWRGVIGGANAAAAFGGVYLSRNLTSRWMGRGLGEPIKMTGWVLFVIGPGLIIIALSPNLPFAIVASLMTNFVGGMFWVPFLTTQALVAPARFRTMALNFGQLFLIAGLWGLWLILPISTISDKFGIRWGLGSLAPYWLIGGLVLRSAHRFVQDDANRALENLQFAATLRQERLTRSSDRLLVVTGLDVAYDGVQVLFGVDFEVREGQVVALLGTNGAGKSTLLKAISGLVHPSRGSVFFDAQDITYLEPEETASAGIIQMPGGKSVFPSLSVKENLDMSAWLYSRDRPYVKEAIDRVLGIFPILGDRMDLPAGALSGGEQQMLSLAQAFIAKPRLLMIDELSLGLAPLIVQQLFEIVREIHERGTTIILVEQSVNVALTIAERAYFMEKGEIRFEGQTAELLDRRDILRSVFLEGAMAVGDGLAVKAPRRRR